MSKYTRISMNPRFLIGLDIGTASVKGVLVENRGGRPIPRAVVREASAGISRGAIVDIAEASQAVGKVMTELKRISKQSLKSVFVNLGSHQVKCQSSRGIVAVSRADAEIHSDDVERVERHSVLSAAAPGQNWMMIHHIPREYIVDGIGDIFNPIGLSGTRLEVQSIVVNAFSAKVQDVIRVIEVNGGQVGGIFFSPLAVSRSVLTNRQKRLGTAAIDLGAGTTGLAVYEENKLLGTALFPVGAANVTNDIAVGLRIPVQAAEKVKLEYGYAIAKEINQRETIDLAKIAPGLSGSVSRRFVADIIEARLAEIFELVNNELKLFTKAAQLPGGVVLTGGGAKLPGLTDLVRSQLKLSAQIGFASDEEWQGSREAFGEYFEDPEFANVLGLALHGAEKEQWRPQEASGTFSPRSIARLVKYFLP